MNKIILFVVLLFTTSINALAQNENLMRWVNDGKERHSNTEDIKEKKEKRPRKMNYVGIGIGYAFDKYVPINIHYTYKKIYYGLSCALPINKGTEGEHYTVVNWDEMPEDHIKEGSYYTPITFDIGYDIRDLTLGIGAGIAIGTKYRNCFDNYQILGNNGSYYKELKGQTSGEFKAFIKYRFPSEAIHFYLSGQYTLKTGVGILLGFDI